MTRFVSLKSACSVLMAALFLTQGCGKKSAQDPVNEPIGPESNKDGAKGEDAVAIPVVSSADRSLFLNSYAQELVGMVEGEASVAAIGEKLANVCPAFQKSFEKIEASSKVLRPLCVAEAPDIDTYQLIERAGSVADGTSLISKAVRGRETGVIEILLPYVNANQYDSKGKTLVMLASELGRKEAFLLLSAKGADLTLLDSSNCDAVCWAKKGTQEKSLREEFVKFVETETALQAKRGLDVILLSNVTNGRDKRDLTLITRLVNSGANVNVKYEDKKPLVVFAIDDFHLAFLNVLIARDDLDLAFRLEKRGKRGATQNLREYAQWLRDFRMRAGELEHPTEADQVIARLQELETQGRMTPATR